MTTKPTDAGRYIRRSREEVARLAEGYDPSAYAEWQRKAPPATPEELAEMEELMRMREAAREASLAAEAGMDPGAAPRVAPATEPSG